MRQTRKFYISTIVCFVSKIEEKLLPFIFFTELLRK